MNVTISPISYEEEKRILVEPEQDSERFRTQIRLIKGARWSPILRAWHLPYSNKTYLEFKNVFQIDFQIIVNKKAAQKTPTTLEIPLPDKAAICFSVSEHPELTDYLSIILPLKEKDLYLEKVKNIHGRRWNDRYVCWEVPYTQMTLRFIRQYFEGIIQ